MDLHFGTPARLERQIAQDLMQEQSEFDLSLPGGDTRDISASISRTPLAPSNRHNSSFSRPSDSSDASTPAKHTRLDRPLATTLPVTLAAAVHNASTQPSQEHHHPISASSSTSSVSDSPHSAHFPDPYTHVRSTSPPLTSTPHRTVGAASTVGSRSRTMTARPLAEATSTQRYDDTTKTSAASRAARSSRSASALLDDLTESSIAPEDATDAHTDRIHNTSSAPQPHPHQLDGHDLVVYDAPSSSSSKPLDHSPAASEAIDWHQRRAQRRRLVQLDESAVDDDDDTRATQDAPTAASSQAAEPEPTPAPSAPETEYTATTHSSPAAARLVRQGLGAASRNAQAESAASTPVRQATSNFATPKQAPDSEERARMKQYLLNSVKATDRTRLRTGRSSDAHLEALERLKAQAQLHQTPTSRSEPTATTPDSAAPSSAAPPSRRMDRLGRANTIAAGRTPLPKGGAAALLRRGALMDSSTNSSAVQSPLLRAASEPVPDADDASAVGSATYSEASSNDLALAPNASKHSAMGLRANTSFPGLGAAEAGTEANSVARPRVDAAKLALYQSKLNARLDAENSELKKERDQLLAKLAAFEQATGQADGEMLEQVRNELQQEKQRADALDEEAQQLADLVDDKEREIEALKSSAAHSQDNPSDNEEQLREEIDELKAELKERQEDMDELEARLERERVQMEEQVQQAKAFSFQTLDRIEAERDQALERIQSLEAQLNDATPARTDATPSAGEIEALQTRIGELEADKQQLVSEMEAKDAQVRRVEGEIEALREQARADSVRIRGLERRLNATNAQLSKAADAHTSSVDYDALRQELEEAQAHIAELEAQRERASSQDERVQMLEQHKIELEQRVQQYREMISRGVGTNLANISRTDAQPSTPVGSSPLPKSVMSLRNVSAVRTPRSPGPLSEASWLYNESTLGAANVVERIAYLEGALDEANASIDAKLQQLDSAGVAHLTLAQRLQQAQERIAELEAELERLRGAGDVSKSVGERQQVFADVHAQLEALKSRWASDHGKLQERERELERRERELGDRSAERRQHRDVLAELQRAKEAARSLQLDLQTERARQTDMLAEEKHAGMQRDAVEGSLQRTHAQLDTVKRRLQDKLDDLNDLSRDDAGETHSRQAQAEVDALRRERNELLAQRAELHAEFAGANEKYARVVEELRASRAALAEHQTQLDEQIVQMEAAHVALRSKKALYEQVVGDRDRLRAERDLIVRDVGTFEHELRSLRREADRQGQDLQHLRQQRDQARRQNEDTGAERAQFIAQVKILVQQLREKTDEVEGIKTKLDALEANSLPPPYVDSRHAEECKGLLLRIKYLKLKLARESDRCADLAHQKKYISQLLAGLAKSDAALAKILLDLDLHSPAKTKSGAEMRWAKACGVARAVARMQLLAKRTHEERRIKSHIDAAHADVRARRVKTK
ncbi:hypothetical protein PANT_7c00071 [Moesziomyces antarcticus T-34]|uniref:Pericentrin/AKAP-450 centrosomal targeting domain-containing protein n=1 Tax=Pseudozyma antarctica (strain T-34) TaxID=1151754 RepID=M9LLH7_PSEA3|nr:hypothetical protein PANT_7c00071 [Moesziomyces antarcticus T-34]